MKNYLTLKSLIIAVAFAVTLLAADGAAQRPPGQGPPPGFGPPPGGRGPGPEPRFPPPGPNFDFLAAEMRPDGPTVKGAPYSATAVTESVQTLADGTRISNKSTAETYRDGEGRTRREQTLNLAGPFKVAGEPPRIVFINDPVAGVHYSLDPQQRRGRKFTLPQRPEPPPGFSPPGTEASRPEALGKQMIEGVEAEGTRSTVTIPVGRIGNDRLLEIVSERWFSTELKTVVLSKHKDPRLGETVYRLTNIHRDEPAKSLFETPAGYEISEGPPEDRRGGPPPGGRGRRPKDQE